MRKAIVALALLLVAAQLPAQTSYQPKFAGDKAKSNAEAAALGYMRTVITAEKLYQKKHGSYSPSLAALVGSGSFTRRMASPDRGDYRVNYRATKDGYALALTPTQFDADHRAFFTDQSGVLRAEETKAANTDSPPLR